MRGVEVVKNCQRGKKRPSVVSLKHGMSMPCGGGERAWEKERGG